MIDLLVVSQSSLAAINRVPYRLLRDAGWNVELVIPERFQGPGFDQPAEPADPDDPPIHLLPITSSHPRLWTYRGLEAVLDARRPRIVHTDVDPGSRLSLQLGWWARRNNAHVTCLSCDNMPRSLWSELSRSIDSGLRFTVTRSLGLLSRFMVDHVFAISSDIREVMRSIGFGDRVSVIPLGFDHRLFRPDAETREVVRRQLHLTQTTVAYFGRLIPEKGVHRLIDALAQLKDMPWQLLMDEFREYTHPYVAQIREQIEHAGIAERVVYFDAKHHEMPRFMNAADIVVVPSESNPAWKEQYGRVAPEAMACGRAVVVSSCGALPELVGDAGIVFPEADTDALRNAIKRLLADEPARSALGAAGYARAHASLSVRSQVEGMSRIFKRWHAPTGNRFRPKAPPERVAHSSA